MAKEKKKLRRNVGDVLSIPLADGTHCYAIVLPQARFAFFDYHGQEDIDVGEIVKRTVLFQLFVMDYAATSGRWPIIGHVDPSPVLLQSPVFFKQDTINKSKFWLYRAGEDEISATREQCEGLERVSVWDPEHVEDRLLDHYMSRPNKWVESSKERLANEKG